jgi:iron-sulfur cluster repair protein YtfE (RIC family)
MARQGKKAMDIQRYHRDHATILQQIDALRTLSRAGVRENAGKIGEAIVSTASHIKFHLAAEDQVLYPRLAKAGTPEVAELSARYQAEMQGIAQAFAGFVSKWRVPARLEADPDGFRHDANTVLRALYERLRREDVELYPVAEQV